MLLKTPQHLMPPKLSLLEAEDQAKATHGHASARLKVALLLADYMGAGSYRLFLHLLPARIRSHVLAEAEELEQRTPILPKWEQVADVARTDKVATQKQNLS